MIDGERYNSIDEAPDLGSWVAEEGNSPNFHRNYYGLSGDRDKLPTYDSLASGCTAFCMDSGEVFIYHSGEKQWYKQ